VPASITLRALGTTAVAAVTEPDALLATRAILLRELRALDLACSRFRPDSELQLLNGGRRCRVSPLLWIALEAALEAAQLTEGLVDPTIGRAIRYAGYDRTFAQVRVRDGRLTPVRFVPAGRWEEIELDRDRQTVRVPAGVELDLGASAKAFAADRIAALVAETTGTGVLVALGGDVAVAGPAPAGGWIVGIDHDHRMPPEQSRSRVAVQGGGLASSGTRGRRWRTTAGELHHILDPRTGRPARGPWTTATVAAASCLHANAASTASIVLGSAAPAWLTERCLPSRLARADGTTVCVAGWPAEQEAA
jgi:thiamine biosynthesis lipoprotein